MDPLSNLVVQGGALGWREAAFHIVLAFTLAQVIATVYVRTFQGLSYSRNFVQAIPLGATVTATLMMAIGDNIAAGVGLAGGLSIIRFRATMRDPRDMVFVFGGLAVGMTTGLGAVTVAVPFTALFCIAAWAMTTSAYGARQEFDAIVRFQCAPESSEEASAAIASIAPKHVLVTMRTAHQGTATEQAYHLQIPSNDKRSKLVRALEAIPSVQDVELFLQEPTREL